MSTRAIWLALVASFFGGPFSHGSACENAVILLDADQTIARYAHVEELIDAGDERSAAIVLQSLQSAPDPAREAEMRAARERVFTLVAIRTGGWLDPSVGYRRQRSSLARGALDRAIAALRQHDPQDPRTVAWLAEGLVQSAATRAEGAALLEDLATRDLMPDAWAWRALALGRTDRTARRQALARCREVAGTRARLCATPAPTR